MNIEILLAVVTGILAFGYMVYLERIYSTSCPKCGKRITWWRDGNKACWECDLI